MTFTRRARLPAALASAMLLVLAAPIAAAQHPGASPAGPSAGATTQTLQPGADDWAADPHMHAFYDLSVKMLGKGAGPLKFDDYQAKSYAIFRDFGVARGVGADHMVDHLKDIPRQVVDIVKGDPKTLDSYENFRVALFGPA